MEEGTSDAGCGDSIPSHEILLIEKAPPTFLPLTVLPAATLSVEVRCPSGHVVVLSVCDAASLASLFVALGPQAREGQPC